ncbi:MAG: sucrase ferredoxin [Propionibacteriales bacterium]|nr:sucrase ferredoxin [Propionibacteriales bacterium]
MSSVRCAATSLSRNEPILGTASTVRGYLLVEYAGAWGRDALRDSRLPDLVKAHLRRTSRDLGIKALLIRRHERQRVGATGCRVFVAYADPNDPWMQTTELGRHQELLDLDLTAFARGTRLGLTAHHDPLLLTCTHGRHDTCCAERGRPIAKALAVSHPDLSWEVSHIGGDRFAGNMLVLPHGLYYGRVGAAEAVDVATGHLDGRLTLERLRGRSGYPFAVQAAETYLRKELGETGLATVRLRDRRRKGDDWSVDFDVAGRKWRVELRMGIAEPSHLTCTAQRLDAAPTYQLDGITQIGPALS